MANRPACDWGWHAPALTPGPSSARHQRSRRREAPRQPPVTTRNVWPGAVMGAGLQPPAPLNATAPTLKCCGGGGPQGQEGQRGCTPRTETGVSSDQAKQVELTDRRCDAASGRRTFVQRVVLRGAWRRFPTPALAKCRRGGARHSKGPPQGSTRPATASTQWEVRPVLPSSS